LHRTGASGGGSASVSNIYDTLFKKPFCDLNKKQKATVKERQRCSNRWRNDTIHECVYSVACKMEVVAFSENDVQMCTACKEVYHSKGFRNAIAKPMPCNENFKFLNQEYWNKTLGQFFVKTQGLLTLFEGDVSGSSQSYSLQIHTSAHQNKDSIPARFIRAVLNGDFKGQPVFMGMVEAMCNKNVCEQRGLGMQNFQYTLAYDEFCHL
ncbi:hypothetical protein K439DRAFT_1235256, partial [Ramaria rubella]